MCSGVITALRFPHTQRAPGCICLFKSTLKIEISQECLGISNPRKTDPVELGTSISAASKYSPVCVGYHTLISNLMCGILYHTLCPSNFGECGGHSKFECVGQSSDET